MFRRNAPAKPASRRGTILVWAALCLTLIMGMVAFSLDWGYLVVADSDLQDAADAAAMSAARGLKDGRPAAIALAQTWASKNTAAGRAVALKTDEDVEVGVWDDKIAAFTPLAATSTISPDSVRVTCRLCQQRGNQVLLFFAPILGTRSADVTARATARLAASRCGLIIGLDWVVMSSSSHTDSYASEDGPYDVAKAGMNGHVCTNGTITMSGSAAIHGDAHYGAGYKVVTSGTAAVLGTSSVLAKPISYPPADPGNAATVNQNSTIPKSVLGKVPVNSKGEFVLSSSDNVTLQPGTYYFTKLTLSGTSSINVIGETIIYVTGDVAFSGGTITNSTQKPSNLQLYPMGSKCDISGSSSFYGLVYGPQTAVIRSGSADYYGAIVGKNLTLSGEGGIHADDSLNSAALGGISRVVLVE